MGFMAMSQIRDHSNVRYMKRENEAPVRTVHPPPLVVMSQ